MRGSGGQAPADIARILEMPDDFFRIAEWLLSIHNQP
jgi:hypothetical protein